MEAVVRAAMMRNAATPLLLSSGLMRAVHVPMRNAWAIAHSHLAQGSDHDHLQAQQQQLAFSMHMQLKL